MVMEMTRYLPAGVPKAGISSQSTWAPKIFNKYPLEAPLLLNAISSYIKGAIRRFLLILNPFLYSSTPESEICHFLHFKNLESHLVIDDALWSPSMMPWTLSTLILIPIEMLIASRQRKIYRNHHRRHPKWVDCWNGTKMGKCEKNRIRRSWAQQTPINVHKPF